MRWIALLAVSGSQLGCAGYGRDHGDLWAAGVAAGLAGITSLPSLVHDDGPFSCPESCPPEFSCNHRTGLCDRAECGGHCGGSQHCVVSGSLETCVALPPYLPVDPTGVHLSQVLDSLRQLRR